MVFGLGLAWENSYKDADAAAEAKATQPNANLGRTLVSYDDI